MFFSGIDETWENEIRTYEQPSFLPHGENALIEKNYVGQAEV